MQHLEDNVEAVGIFFASTKLTRPLFSSGVSCGKPFPVEPWVEGRIDLNKLAIRNPLATFYVRASGDSMLNAGIFPGAILVVDRSLEAVDGDVVVARVDDQLTVKRLRIVEDGIWLDPDNEVYEPYQVPEGADFEIWGKVCYSLNTVERR